MPLQIIGTHCSHDSLVRYAVGVHITHKPFGSPCFSLKSPRRIDGMLSLSFAAHRKMTGPSIPAADPTRIMEIEPPCNHQYYFVLSYQILMQ